MFKCLGDIICDMCIDRLLVVSPHHTFPIQHLTPFSTVSLKVIRSVAEHAVFSQEQSSFAMEPLCIDCDTIPASRYILLLLVGFWQPVLTWHAWLSPRSILFTYVDNSHTCCCRAAQN